MSLDDVEIAGIAHRGDTVIFRLRRPLRPAALEHLHEALRAVAKKGGWDVVIIDPDSFDVEVIASDAPA